MTLHPQAVAALELWAQGPHVTDPGFGPADIEAKRRDALDLAAAEPKEPVARVEDVDADGVPARLYVPEGARAGQPGTLVFLHGGGFVFGEVDSHDGQSRRIANRTGWAVLAVDYRRPPEHPFPAAPDDVDAALGWLLREGAGAGLPVERVAAIGDSAGGNLALVAALRNPGLLAALVLVYPFLDPGTGSPSYAATDGGLTRGEAQWYWQQYAAAPADLEHPDLAPLRATDEALAGLDLPVLVQVAEHDTLHDEDVELARRLDAAGVDVSLTTYAGLVHGFWRQPQLFDAAEDCLAETAEFLARVV